MFYQVSQVSLTLTARVKVRLKPAAPEGEVEGCRTPRLGPPTASGEGVEVGRRWKGSTR